MSRESIRQAFKTAVESVYQGSVHTSRLRDMREESECVRVFLNSGEITQNFGGFETESDISVTYLKQNATDAELDLVMDSIITSILTSSEVRSAVGNILFSRFEYDDESDDIVSITYTGTVIY